MEIKTCIDDVKLQIGGNSFIIQRNKEFLIFGNSIHNRPFNARRIINYFPHKHSNQKESVQKLLKNKNKHHDTAIMITNARIEDVTVETIDYVTAAVSATVPSVAGECSPDNLGNINIILLINKNLDPGLLLKSYSWAIEAKVAALWDLDVRSSKDDLATGNLDDSLIVACTGESYEIEGEKELRILILKCVKEATKQSILKSGYKKSVLDYIQGEGIEIEDLVDAGMELIIGVEKSQDIYQKLHEQILKSLEDLNVISFIIAGIRLEEDYRKYRVDDINMDDDPAYFYSDEVLGMSLANQIAGTKAIFNFKRYDEEKPGIIGELGPVLDDIFAGLVAGCMSKIFEVEENADIIRTPKK